MGFTSFNCRMYVCRLKNINSTIIEQTKFHGKDTCFSWYNGLGNWSKNINFVLKS